MKIEKRFEIWNDTQFIGEGDNAKEVCKLLGCSSTTWYNNYEAGNTKFKLRKHMYTILDRLASNYSVLPKKQD